MSVPRRELGIGLALIVCVTDCACVEQKPSPTTVDISPDPAQPSNAPGAPEPPSTTPSPSWPEADAKWRAFAAEHLERMRAIESRTTAARLPNYKFELKWSELKHALFLKHLRDYKIYDSNRSTFALSRSGKITYLSSAPRSEPVGGTHRSAPDLEVKTYGQFVASVGLRVRSERDVFELASLLEALMFRGFPNEYDDARTWKRVASKPSPRRWRAHVEYVGDPHASIGASNPCWELDVDAHDRVHAIGECQQ